MSEVYSKIKVKNKKRASMEIDGDLFATDESYRRVLELAIKWKPNKKIKNFTDKYIPNFKVSDDFGHIILIRKYPKSFRELAEYVLKDRDKDYIEYIIANKSYKLLRTNILNKR